MGRRCGFPPRQREGPILAGSRRRAKSSRQEKTGAGLGWAGAIENIRSVRVTRLNARATRRARATAPRSTACDADRFPWSGAAVSDEPDSADGRGRRPATRLSTGRLCLWTTGPHCGSLRPRWCRQFTRSKESHGLHHRLHWTPQHRTAAQRGRAGISDRLPRRSIVLAIVCLPSVDLEVRAGRRPRVHAVEFTVKVAVGDHHQHCRRCIRPLIRQAHCAWPVGRCTPECHCHGTNQ
jgi:hypothetical protein